MPPPSLPTNAVIVASDDVIKFYSRVLVSEVPSPVGVLWRFKKVYATAFASFPRLPPCPSKPPSSAPFPVVRQTFFLGSAFRQGIARSPNFRIQYTTLRPFLNHDS